MNLKAFIKLFIPPFLILICKKIYILLHNNKIITTLNELNKTDNALIVIGNGPSFKDSIQKYEDKIASHDCIVVNHFCETEYYELLKPKFYLLADPAFWGNLDTFADWKKNKVNVLIDTLITKTIWDISFIVPSAAKDSHLIKRLSQNSFIHPFYYNNRNFVSFESKNKWKLWDKNLISPPAQTCLNTCVYIGIFLRYQKLYLVGADTSWIEQLHVDQNTNEVYTIDKHFYGEVRRTLYEDIDGKHPVKLYREIETNANAVKLYWDLKEYADYAGVKVYNASEYSLIDAFERKKIE